MARNPDLFVRASTPEGHFTMPAAIAERDPSIRVLKQDPFDPYGQPLPPKLRVDMNAATPTTPDPEADAEGTSEESE